MLTSFTKTLILKSSFDNYDELAEDNKKKYNQKQFELDDIISTKSDELKLPKWVKVDEEKLNEILNTITEAKNNGLKTDVNGEEITLDKAKSLLKGVGSGKIDAHEFKEKYNDIVNDAKKILNRQPFTMNEDNMIEILSLLRETIKPGDKKQMNNQILQICLNQKVKNLLNKEEINKEKA